MGYTVAVRPPGGRGRHRTSSSTTRGRYGIVPGTRTASSTCWIYRPCSSAPSRTAPPPSITAVFVRPLCLSRTHRRPALLETAAMATAPARGRLLRLFPAPTIRSSGTWATPVFENGTVVSTPSSRGRALCCCPLWRPTGKMRVRRRAAARGRGRRASVQGRQRRARVRRNARSPCQRCRPARPHGPPGDVRPRV